MKVFYKNKQYPHQQLWRLVDAMNDDGFEVSICCLPKNQYLERVGSYIAQVISKRRGGVDICKWGKSPFEAVKNCIEDYSITRGCISKTQHNYYGIKDGE